MGDVYASSLGTVVMRHRSVPPRPTALDGVLLIIPQAGGELDGDGKVVEDELRRVMSTHGIVKQVLREGGRWRVCFGSHAQAEAAAEAASSEGGLPSGAMAVFTLYTARPYTARGWTTFESGVSSEALDHVRYFESLHALLTCLPAKLVEIDTDVPSPVLTVKADEGDAGVGPRIESVNAMLRGAFFTGKGDKAVVIELYREYMRKIIHAITRSGERQLCTHDGQTNSAGQNEGFGKTRWVNGDMYEGQWVAGLKEGRGRYIYAHGDVYEGEYRHGQPNGRGRYQYETGDVYDGEWVDDAKEGYGTYTFAISGDVYEGGYSANKKHGHGVLRCEGGRHTYDGQFVTGQQEGHGLCMYADGTRYEGKWRANIWEGYGKYEDGDGNRYAGEWVNGQPSGVGAWQVDDARHSSTCGSINQSIDRLVGSNGRLID
uniref:Uncharacterized protein n=1 Tax=Haptolina brevifila TaxID=156173 RepID=A0A7S2NMY5_9EUKA|mmetsp:Transcript_84691/g.169125  ORF Transcript_84691/g.169125 Transcript_84691/m.169125 type:complete len:431 (+) Transcript_84691:609-1901(+)